MAKQLSKLAPAIWEEINRANKILLVLHVYPDGDSVGSNLALWHFLKREGKKVDLIKGDSDLPYKMAYLPGFGEIINKNYFEVNIDDYDLLISVDSMDKTRISKVGAIDFPDKLKVVVIDHHPDNPLFGDINWVDEKYAAAGEMLTALLAYGKKKINSEMAACLYFAIFADTKGYKYTTNISRTLQLASKLAKINPDFQEIIKKHDDSSQPEEIEFISLALSHRKEFAQGNVVASCLDYATLKKNKIRPENSKRGFVAEMLRSVTKYKVTACITEFQKGVSAVVLRSDDGEIWNVCEVAKRLGGGGLRMAAAAEVKLGARAAMTKTVKIIKELYFN